MTGYSVFLQISFLVKLAVMAASFLIFNLAVHLGKRQVFDDFDRALELTIGSVVVLTSYVHA